MNPASRRTFIKTAGAAALAAPFANAAPRNAIPRWRGFNLLYFFQARVQKGPVEIPEDDFLDDPRPRLRLRPHPDGLLVLD